MQDSTIRTTRTLHVFLKIKYLSRAYGKTKCFTHLRDFLVTGVIVHETKFSIHEQQLTNGIDKIQMAFELKVTTILRRMKNGDRRMRVTSSF